MDFTKLPTDNFYIFLSFAGLGIIYLAYLIFTRRINHLNESLVLFKKTIIERKNHISFLSKKNAHLTKKIHFLESEFKLKFKLDFFRSEIEVTKELTIPKDILHNNLAYDFIEDYLKIDKLYLYLDKQIIDAKLSIDLLDYESDLIEKSLAKTESFKIYFKTAVCGGIIILLIGLSSWYLLHQKYQDKLLKMNYESVVAKCNKDNMKSSILPAYRLKTDSTNK